MDSGSWIAMITQSVVTRPRLPRRNTVQTRPISPRPCSTSHVIPPSACEGITTSRLVLYSFPSTAGLGLYDADGLLLVVDLLCTKKVSVAINQGKRENALTVAPRVRDTPSDDDHEGTLLRKLHKEGCQHRKQCTVQSAL